MIFYYLITELPDERLEDVNTLYAPHFGISEHFTADQMAEVMGVRKSTAMRRIQNWIMDGYCKEVI